MKMKQVLLALGFIGASVSGTSAKGLTSGADFLLVNTGARPDALGGAFSAVADDVNTLTYNPAGLANIRLPEVGYGRYDFVAGIHYDFVGLASPLGDYGVLGFGYVGMGTDSFNSTEDPNATPGTASEKALILGWGRSFGRLHLGISGKYVHRSIGTVTGSGFLGDVGFRYRLQPRFTVAGSLMNAGSDISMATGEKPPTTARGGVAWRMIELAPHTIDLTMDTSYSFQSARPLYGWGGEYWYHERYALRLGWVGNSESEGFTTGAGVKISFFQLDYAFQPFTNLGATHRISGIFRWDGPWVKGGEPNPPKYVRARNVAKGLEIRWDKPVGPAQMYEVLVRPLDGGPARVYSRLEAPVMVISDVVPGNLYAISLRTLGTGGGKSFPTQPIYVEREEQQRSSPQWDGRPSEEKGIHGVLTVAGLELQWEEPKEYAPSGYQLFVKTPSGTVKRLTREPKQERRFWLADVSGLEGGEFIVTAVHPNDGSEKRIGSFIWRPKKEELKAVAAAPRMRLKATPQGNGKTFIDWDADPDAVGYTLLYSASGDGVFQLFGDLPKNRTWVILQLLRKDADYQFLVVSRDREGHWLGGSAKAKGMDLSRLMSAPPEEETAPALQQ
jgi:hypothetical protein